MPVKPPERWRARGGFLWVGVDQSFGCLSSYCRHGRAQQKFISHLRSQRKTAGEYYAETPDGGKAGPLLRRCPFFPPPEGAFTPHLRSTPQVCSTPQAWSIPTDEEIAGE